MFSITDFDPFMASGQTWETYYSFVKTATRNYQEKDEFIDWAKDNFKDGHKFKFIYEAGVLIIVIMLFSKKGAAGIELPVIAIECNVKGPVNKLSEIIAIAIVQLTELNAIKSFRITTANPLIQEIINGFSGKIINTINFYQLYRNKLNNNSVKKWLINKYLDSGEFTLAIYEHVPEILYDQFANLMTELMNDILRENNEEHFNQNGGDIKKKMEQYKKNSVKMLTFLLFDLNRQLIGISFMLLNPNSIVAKQYMTGVKRQYRGKKLACYLKASITEEAFRRFPDIEKIETDCNDVNKPMIHINELTGYTLREKSFQFSVDIEKVEEYLSTR